MSEISNTIIEQDGFNGYISAETRSKIILNGDLQGLDNSQLESVAMLKCKKLGLDYSDNPFLLLTLKGKKSFVATKKVANHFISQHNLTVQILAHEIRYRKIKSWSEKRGDFYNEREYVHITVRVTKINGNFVEKNIDFEVCDNNGNPLFGDLWANAIMKAETKVTSRAVYALVGEGILSVDEAMTIEGARITSIKGDALYEKIEQKSATLVKPVEDPRISNLRSIVLKFFKDMNLPNEDFIAYKKAVRQTDGSYEALSSLFEELKEARTPKLKSNEN